MRSCRADESTSGFVSPAIRTGACSEWERNGIWRAVAPESDAHSAISDGLIIVDVQSDDIVMEG